jgi:hypothetical protein
MSFNSSPPTELKVRVCCLSMALLAAAFAVMLCDGVESKSRVAAAIPRVAETQDADDLLVLRFDNSLNGESGETPTIATGTNFQAGVSNQGVLLPAPNQLFYQSANNINATEGTFECWLKPTWNGNDGQGHFILQYGGGGGIVIGKDGANNMRIILNRFGVAPGGEVGVAFNVGSWTANQWHHIAFTWSNSAKQLAVYIDGTLRQQNSFAINLPAISSATFQIGGDGAGGYIQAVVDNLRISNIARSAQEISNHLLDGLTVSSWSLNPATPGIEMYPGWFYWVPLSINAVTNVGNLSLPLLAASWTSSNPAAALMDPSGRIKALAPGPATLTGSLGGQQNSVAVNVLAPVLPPVEETVEPFMATPASGHLYRVPVVIIRYFPTRDGVNLDATVTGTTSTLAALKSNVEQIERRHKFMLEEGSRFRAYGSASVPPSLGYQVIKTITVYEDIPPGFDAGGGAYFPDYNQILTRFGAEHLVNNLGVKEFWLAHWHHGRIVPSESNMSSPTTGDISNSFRANGDQPVYNKTYVTYGINFTRSQAEATHNHGHQLESILSHVNQLRDGNTTLWWQLFAKPVMAGANPPARCGNTHFPPNATQDYDYTNLNLVASDIMNWQPLGGPTTMVNANTWGNVPYPWPGGQSPPQEVESKWYIFWFQSISGWNNAIPYNANKLTNWWQFTADWDAAITAGIGLHEPGACNYSISATGQTVPGSGGTGSVNVTSGAGCKWFASSNEPWITITGGRTGNENGAVNFSVAANTGNQRTGTIVIAGQVFTVTQSAACPAITVNPINPTLPAGRAGEPYSQTFTQTGGNGAVSFTVSAGALPNGLSLSSAGALTGAPTVFGAFNFTVRATDANACTGERAYTLLINPPCPVVTVNPTSLPNGDVGVAYARTITASGGTAPYVFTVSAGGLPNGLSLSPGGTLSGTPSFGGTFGFTIKATDANGCMGARAYAIVISGAGLMYYPLPRPVRLLDTRPGFAACFAPAAPLGNNAVRLQPATGACTGVPANAKAIVGNATVVNSPTISTDFHWITLYPSDALLPDASNLNFTDDQIVPNNFTVGLGADGAFNIYSHAATHFIVDIAGYYAPPGPGGLYYHPLPAPVRLLDTRPGFGACNAPGAPLASDGVRSLTAHGSCFGATIPSTARSVVGNATVVNSGPTLSTGFHWITLYPFDAPLPDASNLNYREDQIVPNAFVAGLSADGKFNIYSHGATHFIVDVAGYFSDEAVDANGVGLLYNPLPAPRRLLDTRPLFNACDAPATPLGADAIRAGTATVACSGVPSGAKAVVGNATVVNAPPLSSGFHWITLYPFGAPLPDASNLNYRESQITPNAFVVGLSADGKFNIYSHAPTHFIIDLTGYFAP